MGTSRAARVVPWYMREVGRRFEIIVYAPSMSYKLSALLGQLRHRLIPYCFVIRIIINTFVGLHSDLDSRFYLVGSGSLRVQSARALDAGAYTCRAHNRIDSDDFTTQLHVLVSFSPHSDLHLHCAPVRVAFLARN